MIRIFLLLVTAWQYQTLFAQETVQWIRYPRISPDGTQIAFGYKGDLYLVSAKGGQAIPLTLHEAHDMMPVWSRDGQQIAFASDRHGQFDVFVMPAKGGKPTRITYHSTPDYPQDFSVDGKDIYFTSSRQVSRENIRFYSPRLFQNLYKASTLGGRAILVSEAGMQTASLNQDGKKIVFQDRKGYEDLLRKHHTSSVTRDVWTLDVITNKYEKLSQFSGEDLEPVFGPDNAIYYLSESTGSLNVVKQQDGRIETLTRFQQHPVRHLSVSRQGMLCFTYQGEIYTQIGNGAAQRIPVTIQNDGKSGVTRNLPVSGQITQFALSPNGKEIAFINRGEVFVTSVEGTQTKRITNTAAQERHVQWHPDGRSIIYASERGQSWDIYIASLERLDELYFYASTIINEQTIIAGEEEEFQGKYSPNGKEIAYVAERNALKGYNVETRETRTLLPLGRNYSYSDGDWDFNWSPDGKFILSDDGEGTWFTGNVALIPTQGDSAIIHPLPSGYGQGNVKWAMDGKAMTWVSARYGRKSMAIQGSRELDIFAGFYDQAAFDRFSLSKEEFTLLEDKEKKEKEDREKKEKELADDPLAKPAKKKKEVTKDSIKASNLLTDRFRDRIKRLTIHSSSISDYALSPDGAKLYYLASFEKGFDLWVTETRTRETKVLAKLGAGARGLELTKDGKSIFFLKDGSLVKIDENGKQESIGVNGEMTLDAAGERNYIFDHAYRQVKKKFYDPGLHGLDWKGLSDQYKKFLPHISNNYDFQELLSEWLGELNASHTGGRYSPALPNPDETGCLGIFFDPAYNGTGLKITEVLSEGPFGKANSKLRAGYILEKIDGVELTADIDWHQLLNRKANKKILVSFREPDSPVLMDEVIKPISFGEENGLLYKRWLTRMKSLVDSLSNGQIGYVHVQGMNDYSYRDVFDEVLGENFHKKALIVDTRFNGGGWLHDDLKTFLSGERYLDFAPQGNRLLDGEPMGRWTKPSCVLMSEGNYSDAFIFPYVYKQAGIGKTIGMPVPGTGTAVWWETQIDPTMVFGIPMVATLGKENRPTENLQLEPDIQVELPFADFLQGKDTQIEAAVQELLKGIKK